MVKTTVIKFWQACPDWPW